MSVEKEEVAIEQSAIVGEDKINDQVAENVDNQFTGRSARINSPQSHEAAQVNNELEQLMALQEQLLTQAAYEESQNDNSDIEEIQQLMEAYGQRARSRFCVWWKEPMTLKGWVFFHCW